MQRIKISARPDYINKLESLSFEFHSLDNKYWNEDAYYKFTMDEINTIENASNVVFDLCLQAVQHVIDNNLFDKLFINPELVPMIIRSWDNEEPSFYGRFDFAMGKDGIPKMLEFNADSPTSLYEAAVVQWYWLNDVFPDNDQFNSMHEKLLNYFQGCHQYFHGQTLHFACIKDSIEDFTTTEYIRDVASQAGLNTKFVYIEDIGWNRILKCFVDDEDQPITNIFKLYPWEWLSNEDFAVHLMEDKKQCKWIEPAWKSILSNKGILPILWELFPDCPYLLPCYFDTPKDMKEYVEKPIYSREGANVAIINGNNVKEFTEGEYGDEGYVYQQYVELPNFYGNNVIIGSWIIDGQSAGIGMRESDSLITNNLSRFVPHIIE